MGTSETTVDVFDTLSLDPIVFGSEYDVSYSWFKSDGVITNTTKNVGTFLWNVLLTGVSVTITHEDGESITLTYTK